MNLSRGDAAVLYGGSKNCFGATGGQFLTFWPTGFSIFFLVDGIFVKISGFRDGFFTKWVCVEAVNFLIDENGHSWLWEVRF